MVSSLLLALALTAWPVSADAGAGAFAEPSNWPREPGWVEAWPLFSYAPAEWTGLSALERDAGVGMRVDQAWSHTRGSRAVTIAVIAGAANVADPLVASAWRLNPGEAPDAGDTNANGRLDVGDFAADPRVTDVNGNGALDLEDVQRSLADGLDQDGNGRVDDLCGWDFDRGAPIASDPDAGTEVWRHLSAAVDDGKEGIGVCPECTLLPIVASSLEDGVFAAQDAGARVVLLPHSERELSARLLSVLDEGMLFVTPGSGDLTTWPLALHSAVLSPRTLTASTDRSTAISRDGCGGRALGSHSISTRGCAPQAAVALAGIAALVFSVAPDAGPTQVSGLLGGPRTDAAYAVTRALEALTPAERPVERGLARPTSPSSAAERCAIDRGAGEEPVSCDGGISINALAAQPLEQAPAGAFVRFIERTGPYEWSTSIPSPPTDTLRGLLGPTPLGPGSGPPRFVDLDGVNSDSVLSETPGGLVGLTSLGVETLSPFLSAGRIPFAIGEVNGDRTLDLVTLGDEGLLEAHSFSGQTLAGSPERLDAAPAGPPVLIGTFGGTAIVTLDVKGRLVHRLGGDRWSTELGAPQVSAPAAGLIDGDASADFAIADGRFLHVVLTDARGPTSASWSVPSRASEALLADLVGDASLEVVADQVFDARGKPILALEDWSPGVVPSALARVDRTSLRALIQVERRTDGAFELTRYDVERALRGRDSLAPRRVLRVFHHPPARGGFAVADVTGDRNPDVLLPTEDGLLYIVDGEGLSPAESPLPAWGTVVSAPAVGVRDDQLEFAVRTTHGDLVRWLGIGLVQDISWESAGHDRANTRNAETRLPARRLGGLGVAQPPILRPGCSCGQIDLPLALGLVFLFRRRRRTC